MSASKRGRACEACSKIKIKCALGCDPDATPPCERCIRLNKECVLSKPQRQKDRVQELEAQVAALTRLLQAQGIKDAELSSDEDEGYPVSPVPAPTLSPPSQNLAQKKRKLVSSSRIGDDRSISTPRDNSRSQRDLDTIVSKDAQQLCLSKYFDNYAATFPLVLPTGDCSLKALHAERPMLLLAIVYAASPGILADEIQEQLCQELLSRIALQAIAEGIKSFELLQALIVTSAWFRTPRHHQHLAAYQLTSIALDMATGIGIADPSSGSGFLVPSTLAPSCANIETVTAATAYLATHRLSATMLNLLRKPQSVIWTSYHDTCLMFLGYSTFTSPEKIWLALYFRAERLCDQVMSKMQLCDPTVHRSIADPQTQTHIQECRTSIVDWRILLPPRFQPEIAFWEYVAVAYMHETVLHTASNKQSFAAPFVPEMLSAMDFPKVQVTESHITSLVELRGAVLSIIDIYSSMDTRMLEALPAFIWTSRALYALFVLIKMYVAVTAPGNTFGAVMYADSLKLEESFSKLTAAWARLDAIDPRSGPARVSSATLRLREWFVSYTSTIASIPSTFNGVTSSADASNSFEADSFTLTDVFDPSTIDWSIFAPVIDDDFAAAYDNAAGLDDLISEPQQTINKLDSAGY